MSDAVYSDLARYEADIDRAERRERFIDDTLDEWFTDPYKLGEYFLADDLASPYARACFGQALFTLIAALPKETNYKQEIRDEFYRLARPDAERLADSPREYDGPDPSGDY